MHPPLPRPDRVEASLVERGAGLCDDAADEGLALEGGLGDLVVDDHRVALLFRLLLPAVSHRTMLLMGFCLQGQSNSRSGMIVVRSGQLVVL